MGTGILYISSLQVIPSLSKSSKVKPKALNIRVKREGTKCILSLQPLDFAHKLELSLKVKFLRFWHVLMLIGEGFSPLAYCFFCYISLFHQLYALNVIPLFFSLVCWTTEPW